MLQKSFISSYPETSWLCSRTRSNTSHSMEGHTAGLYTDFTSFPPAPVLWNFPVSPKVGVVYTTSWSRFLTQHVHRSLCHFQQIQRVCWIDLLQHVFLFFLRYRLIIFCRVCQQTLFFGSLGQSHRHRTRPAWHADIIVTAIMEPRWTCLKIFFVYLRKCKKRCSWIILDLHYQHLFVQLYYGSEVRPSFMIFENKPEKIKQRLKQSWKFRLRRLYMTNFSLFVSSVYSALFINGLLTCSRDRYITYRNTLSVVADISYPLAATSSFLLTGPNDSPRSSAYDLGVKRFSFLVSTSNTFRLQLNMR